MVQIFKKKCDQRADCGVGQTVWPSAMKNTHIVKSAIKALQMGNNSVEKTNGLIYQRTIEEKRVRQK